MRWIVLGVLNQSKEGEQNQGVMVVHACNPSTQEVEAGGSRV
jgi:hypothetical protein